MRSDSSRRFSAVPLAIATATATVYTAPSRSDSPLSSAQANDPGVSPSPRHGGDSGTAQSFARICMFRPAHSNRKIVIDVAVASSVKVRNKVRQAKPLVKAMAAADRKWRQNHLRMPAGCYFKAVTFQAMGGMSIQAQQMLKRLHRIVCLSI